jgi:4-hydroxy-tetrahydrodipicolinate synthase
MVRQGRIDDARRISDALAPLRAAWAWGSFPVVIKEAMALSGRSAGPARPPIGGLAPEKREDLRRLVESIQEIELQETGAAA